MSHPQMKAVVALRYGPPEVLKIKEIAEPIPRANEILVRVMATAVNSGDVRVRGLQIPGILKYVMRLVLGITRPRRSVLGTVYAGIVCSVGEEVESFQPGDEVFGMTGLNFGTYAEYVRVNENSAVAPKPWNASFEESAAIIFGGTTALHFLQKAKVDRQFGKRVLIYGASGAVGSSAVQLARRFGAKVTAVCSQANAEWVKSLGADLVIDYNQEDFTSSGRKYDLIFDAVGKIKKKNCKHCLDRGGQFRTVGGLEMAKETRQQLLILKDLFESNQLNAAIDKTYMLNDIVDAHRYVDTGRKRGNVVVKLA